MAGVYISYPFCAQKCTYCNFASGVFPAELEREYLAALCSEIAAQNWTWQPETVYLGGGTPTLLAPELIARLFTALRAEFVLEPDAEVTVECAPGQLGDDSLEALAAQGVNRVSLGVQSFIDREAQVSGRLANYVTSSAQ